MDESPSRAYGPAMAKDFMNYGKLVQLALREVVRQTLVRVTAQGLPGNHHLYISFKTRGVGVDIPEYLRERYPDEMTIVLQHQFWGLKADAKGFEVQLSFNKLPERLVIPYAALTGFYDPSVQFGLQFEPDPIDSAAVIRNEATTTPLPIEPKPPQAEAEPPADKAEEKRGEVLTLDAFRKK